jgi:hypothetical protein
MVAHPQAISVGDTVSVTLGTTELQGVVIDDRGPIGAGGVHIFRIRVPNDPYEDDVFEAPEDALAPAKKQIGPIPRQQAVSYLEHGGLVQILKSSMSGGGNQPRVWLRRDTSGNVVHTFAGERGEVGGETAPVSALYGDRVFTPKLGDVLKFLSTFGLTESEAKRVVDKIGTAP